MNNKKASILFCRFLNNISRNEILTDDKIKTYMFNFNQHHNCDIDFKDFVLKLSENPKDVFLNKNSRYYSTHLSFFEDFCARNMYIKKIYASAQNIIKKEEQSEELITLIDLIDIDNMTWEDIETYIESK